MKIIIGKTAGFCYGVRKAVNETKKELKNNSEICCLGEIVHNKSVVKDLEERGITFVNDIDECKGKVIIRAHGESKETYKKLKEKGIEIKDLTCPKVLKTHELAEEYIKHNYFIVLIGVQGHPESIGTLSFCGENSYLLQDKSNIKEMVDKINESKLKDILILAQTTYNSKKFDDIVEEIKKELNGKNIKIKKTICEATKIRQNETTKIAKEVDVMIIVGDKKSSNTNKLYDISKEFCKRTFFVQTAEELDLNELKNAEKIGIMAGASTPEEDIAKIIEKVKEGIK